MHLDKSEKIALVIILCAILIGAVLRVARRTTNAAESQPGIAEVGSYQPRTERSKQTNAKYIIVHVGGEAVNPGVYQLQEGARIIDAVLAAGGGTSKADLDSLNLAQTISDGEKVEVPAITSDGEPDSNGGTQSKQSSKVNVNSSTAEQLDTLPGIGPALAKRIVDDRKINGPFKSLEDLDRVSGIGKGLIGKLNGLAVVR